MESRDVVLLELIKEKNPTDLRSVQELLSEDRPAGRARLMALAASGSAMSAYLLATVDRSDRTQQLILDETSESWLGRAAALGCHLAAYRLGNLYFQNKRYNEAKKIFAKCVSEGYAPAFRLLSAYYECGIGVEKNLVFARDLLERGAAKGSLRAQSQLAWLFMKGKFGYSKKLRGAYLLISSLCVGIWVWKKFGIYSIRLV